LNDRAAICARIWADRGGTELGVRRTDRRLRARRGQAVLKDQLAGQPVSNWAKLLIALQSIVSIVVVGSVAARAVSVPS
jgi:hypothetical protein